MPVRKIALLSKEYPPHVYGGAGVHVEYLARALARLLPVEVRCFGDQHLDAPNLTVRGYAGWDEMARNTDPRFIPTLDAFARSLAIAKDRLDADLVHAHTWYTDMAGLLAARLWGIPYVLTVHSLEPLRPWKVEQLGNGYHLSAWMERTALEQADAVIAVSAETRADILRLFPIAPDRVHVIHNGIDPDEYHPAAARRPDFARYGIDPTRPYLLFVGRITRQKGIIHLVRACADISPDLQIVLCAGAPDTPEIATEMRLAVAAARARRPDIIWIADMLPRAETIGLYAHAAIFCCPSVYEPFGIINLEAMACNVPVVASAVGGIPEVVIPNETGFLVDPDLTPGTFDPRDPADFARRLATAINTLAANPSLRQRFGQAGRDRVERNFSWHAIAERTLALYKSLGK